MTENDLTKFKEMIKYISVKCLTDEYYGRTKLNKILFFADFLAYRELGQSISGVGYHKEPFGPVPNSIRNALQELYQSGEMLEIPNAIGQRVQKRPVACNLPDLNLFSSNEIALLDEVIEDLEDRTASDVSNLSHKFIGWQAVNDGGAIPYETVFCVSEPIDEDDVEWAKSVEFDDLSQYQSAL